MGRVSKYLNYIAPSGLQLHLLLSRGCAETAYHWLSSSRAFSALATETDVQRGDLTGSFIFGTFGSGLSFIHTTEYSQYFYTAILDLNLGAVVYGNLSALGHGFCRFVAALDCCSCSARLAKLNRFV